TDFDDVVGLDLKYIDNWSFLDDLVIIWKTIVVVLRRKGAI
ncbi:MAG: sugar transferase, partial [Proteobacteria bacterium]|nr:sugar transferase [Pseudomonadota bacterium]MBU1610475.1 sugar transferase [Pseudomonadota bacterium]